MGGSDFRSTTQGLSSLQCTEVELWVQSLNVFADPR